MKTLIISIIINFILVSAMSQSFIDDQKRYPRVRQAFADKEKIVMDQLGEYSITSSKLNIYLRAFKKEKKIELWAKNNIDSIFRLIREYDICQTSGKEGPKRKQGDMQIPEGFYHIDRFNPASSFYLSLGLSYPNKSDRILGVQGNLGGDIFIHGSCVTIGCLPITDDKIKELYLLCIMARSSGQKKIPVTIFPAKMSGSEYEHLKRSYESNADIRGLWTDLEKAYESFEKSRALPDIIFLDNGRHQVNQM